MKKALLLIICLLFLFGIINICKAKENSNEYKTELEVYPWMEENENAEGLLVSLRNESDIDKSNTNFYMLDEEVHYLVDYKNAGEKIKNEIKIELKLPLKFEVIDVSNGEASTSKKTITWTLKNGMEQGESDTRRVIIRYKSLNKSTAPSEIVYPQATIYKSNNKKDVSSVINCIYKDDLTYFKEKHKPYMLGDEGKATFRPNDGITRAEGALVLMRVFGIETKNVKKITDKFSDINDTYLEAQKAITKALDIGIINGYPDGTYRPKAKMTRAEFMKIISAYLETVNKKRAGLEIKDNNILIYKNDNSKVDWAVPYVTLLVRLNMTSASYNEKDLRLGDNITRAEVAQLCNFYLFRAPAKVTANTTINFEDVTRSHKLFEDIVEATRQEHEFTVTSDGKEKIK